MQILDRCRHSHQSLPVRGTPGNDGNLRIGRFGIVGANRPGKKGISPGSGANRPEGGKISALPGTPRLAWGSHSHPRELSRGASRLLPGSLVCHPREEGAYSCPTVKAARPVQSGRYDFAVMTKTTFVLIIPSAAGGWTFFQKLAPIFASAFWDRIFCLPTTKRTRSTKRKA